MIDQAVDELAPAIGVKAACAAVGRPRQTHHRWHRKPPPAPKPERVPRPQPRALCEVERKEALTVLQRQPRRRGSGDGARRILDQSAYLASTSNKYRILRTAGEVRERRRQATHPAAKKRKLLATAPNAVGSWDITKLLGPEKWTYYYLYVIIDIYSRYVPAGYSLEPSEPTSANGCWPTPSPSKACPTTS